MACCIRLVARHRGRCSNRPYDSSPLSQMLDGAETGDVHCAPDVATYSPLSIAGAFWADERGQGVRFSMTTVSIWQDTSIWSALPHRREEADVCIIGAGIVGSTLAHFLGQAGKSVIVLEARDV